jgi:hypothetical protein
MVRIKQTLGWFDPTVGVFQFVVWRPRFDDNVSRCAECFYFDTLCESMRRFSNTIRDELHNVRVE